MSDAINPNTPVTETAITTEIKSGDGPASFDELDQLLYKGKGKAKADKSDDGEGKEDPKPKAKDLIPDDKKGDSKKEAKDDKKPGKEKDAKEVEAQKARKTFKGKYTDKEYDIDEDAEFTVKINGQDIPVKAKDLFSNYSGKIAWDKKFSELDKDRKAYRGEYTKLEDSRKQVREMFEEKDPTVRMFKMAQIAGVSPVEFRKKFFDDAIKDIETYYSLSEDERKARDLEYENTYLKYQADASKKSQTVQQAQWELQKKVETLSRQHSIGPDDFSARMDLMNSLGEAEKAAYKEQGKFVDGNPTPEFVVETLVKDNLWGAVENALEGVKVDWPKDVRTKNILTLVDNAYSMGIKAEDLPEIVSDMWGTGKAKKVVEEKERERQEHLEGKKTPPSMARASGGEAMFFDEL